jgi:hypothetical protein
MEHSFNGHRLGPPVEAVAERKLNLCRKLRAVSEPPDPSIDLGLVPTTTTLWPWKKPIGDEVSERGF